MDDCTRKDIELMRRKSASSKRLVGLAVVASLGLISLTQVGCTIYSNLAHAVGADLVPAKYSGLQKQKVAVIATTDNSQYSDDISARILADKVHGLLDLNVKGIEMVRPEDVDRYRDENGWDAMNLRELGQSVGADKVVSVELAGLKLRDNPTLYRGQCDARLFVLDVATGTKEYGEDIDEFVYPVNAAQPGHDTTESRFRKLYLSVLSKRIARTFYPYDHREDFGLDTLINR